MKIALFVGKERFLEANEREKKSAINFNDFQMFEF